MVGPLTDVILDGIADLREGEGYEQPDSEPAARDRRPITARIKGALKAVPHRLLAALKIPFQIVAFVLLFAAVVGAILALVGAAIAYFFGRLYWRATI